MLILSFIPILFFIFDIWMELFEILFYFKKNYHYHYIKKIDENILYFPLLHDRSLLVCKIINSQKLNSTRVFKDSQILANSWRQNPQYIPYAIPQLASVLMLKHQRVIYQAAESVDYLIVTSYLYSIISVTGKHKLLETNSLC